MGNLLRISTLVLVGGAPFVSSLAAWSANGGPGVAPGRDLGKVHFATSCSPAVQAQVDETMVLLYAFWAKDSIAGFRQVLQQDPQCAIAYWGVAMAYQGNPLTAQEPTPEATREALRALDTAKRIGAKTQRERDYIAAVDLIYRDAGKADFSTRRRATKRR